MTGGLAASPATRPDVLHRRTGLRLGPLALGTAPLAGLFSPVGERAAYDALRAAWDAGIRAYDTAPHYGAGLAEQRLGAFLRGLPEAERAHAVVSTKVGRLLVPAGDAPHGARGAEFADEDGGLVRIRDYSRSGVRRSIEDSLRRTGLDQVAIALVHDPDDHLDQAVSETVPELVRMREEGLVRAVGAGMNDAAPLARLVRETDVDCVLPAGRWSLLDRTAARELLPLCARREVAVLVGGVFNSGILADPRPGAMFDYQPAPEPVLSAALEMRRLCEEAGVEPAAAALQFPFRHPAVGTVVVGARSAEEVRQNAGHLTAHVPEQLWERLEALAVFR
ncbi:aldo/keto reductase [Streptomyces sp. NPDC020996]|uniref:aldo/keto reductase n=1 Tax=Streptomyces sp. NPDC020996 TaxID=3154791 RepID=UPI0033F18849